MKKIILRRNIESVKFGVVFPRSIPLNCSDENSIVQHPTRESLSMFIDPKNFFELELLDTEIEVNEDFIPNNNLTYDIYYAGNTFYAILSESNNERKVVSVEDAPKVLIYKIDKELEDFTDEEKREILDYRGLSLGEDGFELMDVFMHKSYTTLLNPLLNI